MVVVQPQAKDLAELELNYRMAHNGKDEFQLVDV